MNVNELERLVGGLSTPSKMPGFAYGLPASECIMGKFLATLENGVCKFCYAKKGMYVFRVVREAQARRLKILREDMHAWMRAMVSLLEKKYARKVGDERVFRWHDSGDLQSVEHLSAIVQIAKALPSILFWLPTHEPKMIRDYLAAGNSFPDNLTVRISAPVVGQESFRLPKGTVGSTVGSGKGWACPARMQGNACQACRACWQKSVESVDYPLH